MSQATHREIPFNYTSADDRQAITWLLGEQTWQKLEQLRARRVTGRSARLLMRVFGELLVHRRNPFLYEELAQDARRRRQFFRSLDADLSTIQSHSAGEQLVADVLNAVRQVLESFRQEVKYLRRERERITKALGALVGKDNVLFDPFTLVSHATDATDWRLFLPLAVVMPTEESQVAPLLLAIGRLKLHAIARGAGTGLTGGAVPLRPRCVVINTEKLSRIRGIEERTFELSDGRCLSGSVLKLEAGVITERAMEHAAEQGLVFATDPTSAWASTIGGNIAENAGGKTAVLWGTCIDNLLAYQMAMPDGTRVTVRRLDHQLRKILPEDTLTWQILDSSNTPLRTLTLRGDEIRRKGLWKDITNKTLKGLPGLQKEGTDGLITSAEFILYKQYEFTATLCLEFFGPDMDEASRVILELSRVFSSSADAVLQALEHFDNEYVKAIGYQVKAARAEAPKAVLLIDVVAHAAAQLAGGVARIREILASHRNTYLFEATDAAEAKLFWADRKKLGAIASRTNAFKLNEDVVLPLTALAEFARFCEGLNLEEERHAQLAFARRAGEFLQAVAPQKETPWLAEKVAAATSACAQAATRLARAGETDVRELVLLTVLQLQLAELVRGYAQLGQDLAQLFAEERRRRIVIATHMHAGDGNVHVNIPVLSNDRAMMLRAENVVDAVMAKVQALGGVCSGEHGIGVTKLKYLEPERIRELDEYRRGVDSAGMMNPGKLSDLKSTQLIFTPSFNLLKLEARILQYAKLEELAMKIANCVRCGKCKADCCVFHPARALFYHPRNKNLAIGALIEALLYEAQRERAASFGMLRYLEQVADHCTICHKCAKPCPVDIDTGNVSMLEREILVAHGFKHTALATQATLRYLESRSPAFNLLFRGTVVKLGAHLQRTVAKLVGPVQSGTQIPRALQLFCSQVPLAETRTLRALLPHCEAHQALLFEPEGEAKGTVFYFPGCGSERLYSSISMAALHVLLHTGTRVVLPPPFLCCGFPHRANAQADQHGRIVLRNSIVFSQIREMLSYLHFDAVLVTCGTCREALAHLEAGKIFAAPVVDTVRYAAERGLSIKGQGGGGDDYLYHAPCHDSCEGQAPSLLKLAAGLRLKTVPHCCSEAGTLALSRPDISNAMLHRKALAVQESLGASTTGTVMLTNCPSCLQGLGRHGTRGGSPRHIVVELARRLSGEQWIERFRAQAARASSIKF